VALAHRVGVRGKVVGVDLGEAMVTVAAARAEPLSLPVVFRRADIHDLPFVDGSFDATRIDWVLHFLPDPARALREAARVTVPGGCIVITEADWGSLQISGGDPALTAIIAEAAVDLGSAARIGRFLSRLLAEAGLLPTGSHASSLELCDYAGAAALFGPEGLAAHAVTSSRVSGGEAVGWLRSLRLASAEGGFRCTLGGVIASGIRPATPGS
jgi:SAM-dependent methyltransferase